MYPPAITPVRICSYTGRSESAAKPIQRARVWRGNSILPTQRCLRLGVGGFEDFEDFVEGLIEVCVIAKVDGEFVVHVDVRSHGAIRIENICDFQAMVRPRLDVERLKGRGTEE